MWCVTTIAAVIKTTTTLQPNESSPVVARRHRTKAKSASTASGSASDSYEY